MDEPTNWGRWGADDERGAANFVTPEVLRRAAGLVRRGVIYSLSIPIQREGIPIGAHRERPLHRMTKHAASPESLNVPPDRFCDADDHLSISVHTGTHIDALAHVWYNERLYNNFLASEVNSCGAERLGIEKLGALAGRGVMLDLCASRGVSHLQGGEAIRPQELQECAHAQKVELKEGDILLVRTGWLSTYDEKHPDAFWQSNPGLGVEAAEWAGASRFAAIGADNFALEVHPSETGFIGPVHMRLIRDFGCYLMELLNLDELARDRVYEFFFVAAPLRITGGVGSPINPLAIV